MEKNIAKTKKTELSIFNVILCMIVVLIHLMSKSRAELQQFPDAPLYKVFVAASRATTFVVQAFIFISAIKTFLNDRRENYGKFIAKRIKTVIIPYIIAVLLYYIYFAYYMRWLEPSAKDFFGYLLRGDLAAHFYFIIVIAQFYVLYPLWRFILSRVNPIIAIAISWVITALCGWYAPFILNSAFGISVSWLDRTFTTYLLYWVLGMYAGKYYDSFIKYIKRFGWVALVAAVGFAVLDSIMVFMQSAGRIGPLHLDAVHGLFCVFAMISGLYISYCLRNHANLFVRVLDGGSYYIYLIHILFINILDYNLSEYHVNGVTLDFAARTVTIYAAVIILAWAMYLIKKGIAAAKPQRKHINKNRGL